VTGSGFLLLFDLSGYTEFLVRSELHRAPGILQSLLGTVVEHIEAPLEIAEVEGDAIFAYAPEGSFRRGETLVEGIERIYCAFAAAREQMERNATCDCAGCRMVAGLDMKVIAHHGTFALGRMRAGREVKPVGAEVVVAHRLLKNRITEATGVRAYAYFTQSCVDALGLDWIAGRATAHAETYEHVGSVSGYVHDLHPVWAAERERRLVRVEAADAWIEVETELEAPRQVVWDAISGPAYKSLWRYAERVESPGGRTDAGTTQRCYTGESVTIEKVVDWRPFEHLTLDCEWPMGARFRVTTELSATARGTRLVTRLGRPAADDAARALLVRSVYALRARRIEQQCRDNLEKLKALVTAQRTVASGVPGPGGLVQLSRRAE
jgi:hypothetical protein